MNRSWNSELIQYAIQKGASYDCPECDMRVYIDSDVVVKNDLPALVLNVECSECGYSTKGMIETERLDV